MRSTAREWVSFEDRDGSTWLLDVTFLTSPWSCTFGTTCQGTEPGDDGSRGCCAHGAHLADESERQFISEVAAQLDDNIWQNRYLVGTEADLFTSVDGETATAVVDGACIFHNDRAFAGGHGCALHLRAVLDGADPMRYKPDVCWQLPFRVEHHTEDAGTELATLRPWRRSDWGEGGSSFQWWCTEEIADAQDATYTATWESHQAELRQLLGDDIYNQFTEWVNRPSESPVTIDRSLPKRAE